MRNSMGERAKEIRPPNDEFRPPADLTLPSSEQLGAVLRVEEVDGGLAVGTLGIPGEGIADRLCYHEWDSVRRLPSREEARR